MIPRGLILRGTKFDVKCHCNVPVTVKRSREFNNCLTQAIVHGERMRWSCGGGGRGWSGGLNSGPWPAKELRFSTEDKVKSIT